MRGLQAACAAGDVWIGVAASARVRTVSAVAAAAAPVSGTLTVCIVRLAQPAPTRARHKCIRWRCSSSSSSAIVGVQLRMRDRCAASEKVFALGVLFVAPQPGTLSALKAPARYKRRQGHRNLLAMATDGRRRFSSLAQLPLLCLLLLVLGARSAIQIAARGDKH